MRVRATGSDKSTLKSAKRAKFWEPKLNTRFISTTFFLCSSKLYLPLISIAIKVWVELMIETGQNNRRLTFALVGIELFLIRFQLSALICNHDWQLFVLPRMFSTLSVTHDHAFPQSMSHESHSYFLLLSSSLPWQLSSIYYEMNNLTAYNFNHSSTSKFILKLRIIF